VKVALLTGAAGFIGSHIADKLLDLGYRVVGIDNFFRGKKENLPDHENFVFHELDLTSSLEELKKVVEEENPDVLYHYAAINGTKYFYDIPYDVFNNNILITQNTLQAIKGSTVKKIVYASTSEAYGNNPPLPTSEREHILLNIFTDRDSYSSSKVIGDFYVKMFAKQNNLDYLILRIFNTYGPRMDNTEYGQVIPEFIRKVSDSKPFTIIGDGAQTRCFCYVDDNVNLSVELGENVNNEVINIGGDKLISMLDLAKAIHEISGKQTDFAPTYLPPRDFDTLRRQPDLTLLKKYIPEYQYVSLSDGIKKCIEWYKK
tara:strand:+ start:4312 stop:5259 length:948 start_codon:yes stop_codon:yes gene_type:complete